MASSASSASPWPATTAARASPTGWRSTTRSASRAGGARHRADRRRCRRADRRIALRRLALVLPRPARRPARAAASPPTPRTSSSRAGASTCSRPRPAPSTGAASRPGTSSTPSARTTARGPPSTSSTTSADRGAGASTARMLALWGADGPLARVDRWRSGGPGPPTCAAAALPCGHYLPEEAPDETYDALHAFLA